MPRFDFMKLFSMFATLATVYLPRRGSSVSLDGERTRF